MVKLLTVNERIQLKQKEGHEMIKKKKYNYFQMFELMTDFAHQAAVELNRELKDYHPDNLDKHLTTMHRYEKEADVRRHEIMQVLAKDGRPPMEREDIVAITNALDDVVDMVEDISIGLYIYNVQEISADAQAYAKVVLKCCDAVQDMMNEFEKFTYNDNVMQSVSLVHRLESEGDVLFAKTTRDLFSEPMDAVDVIRWKSMYGRLEKACDACEEVSHLVESVVLKQS